MSSEFTNDDIRKLKELSDTFYLFVSHSEYQNLFAPLSVEIDKLYDRIADDPPPLSPADERAALERWGTSPTPAHGNICICPECRRVPSKVETPKSRALALAKADLSDERGGGVK